MAVGKKSENESARLQKLKKAEVSQKQPIDEWMNEWKNKE